MSMASKWIYIPEKIFTGFSVERKVDQKLNLSEGFQQLLDNPWTCWICVLTVVQNIDGCN